MDQEQEEELTAEKNENEWVMVQNKKLLYEWPLAKTFCKNLFRMMVYDALEEPVTPLTKTYYVKVKVKEGREADMPVEIRGEVKNTAMLVAREIYEMSEES